MVELCLSELVAAGESVVQLVVIIIVIHTRRRFNTHTERRRARTHSMVQLDKEEAKWRAKESCLDKI